MFLNLLNDIKYKHCMLRGLNVTENPDKNDNTNENFKDKHSLKIFRYKFTKEVTDMLTYFGKLHQYDCRNDYKEAWKDWFKKIIL